jgi:hypothetical protein
VCAFATAALKIFYKMGSNHIIAILSTISCGAIQRCAFATAALRFFYKMGPDKSLKMWSIPCAILCAHLELQN